MIHNRMITGDTSPVYVPATASVAIHSGDLVGLASSAALGAGDASWWSADLATTQEIFHDVALGVSLDYHRSTDASTTHKLQVATRGRYKVACATDANARDIGTFYGPAKASGNALLANVVDVVASPQLAVGRLASPKLATDTMVEIELLGTLTTGGPQAIA